MSILVVEDEEQLSGILAYVLRRAGFDVLCAYDGLSALKVWRSRSPSLVLLDLNLPRLDGWQVCKQIRAGSNTPIIMLTGDRADADVVRGLNLGADDYVSKPFSPAQLIARIEAVLRRSNEDQGRARSRAVTVGEVELDMQTNVVQVAGRSVRLTNVEFRLLHTLLMRDGHVMRHHDLVRRVWGYEGVSDSKMLKSHVRNLRRKIEPDPSEPRYLRTVANVGYRFASRADAQ